MSFLIPYLSINNIVHHRGKLIYNLIGILTSSFLVTIAIFLVAIIFNILLPENLEIVIGETTICNRMPDRTLIINGFVFPLCYRCFFLCYGFVSFFLFFMVNGVKIKLWKIILFCCGIILAIMDGFLQYFLNYESNNIRRIITGFIGGLSIAYVFAAMITFLLYRLNKKNKS